MTSLAGVYFDGLSSKAQSAILEIDGLTHVRLVADGLERREAFSALEVSQRIGLTPRYIRFPDGAMFETADNDGVDQLLAQRGQQKGSRWLYRFESSWQYVVVAAVIVISAAWGAYRYGIPVAARTIAFELPVATSKAIGRGALETLDRTVLAPTDLDVTTRTHVTQLFEGIARDLPPEMGLTLSFRAGRQIGANALALPSGNIVITDELIKLAENDGELVAVLVHEVGHVIQRHGLRQVIQDSVAVLLTILLTGDISSTTALISALPVMLVEAQYSQVFESEADDYALAYLVRQRINPAHFTSFLDRLEKNRPQQFAVPDLLSTHPSTVERRARFEKASQEFSIKNKQY